MRRGEHAVKNNPRYDEKYERQYECNSGRRHILLYRFAVNSRISSLADFTQLEKCHEQARNESHSRSMLSIKYFLPRSINSLWNFPPLWTVISIMKFATSFKRLVQNSISLCVNNQPNRLRKCQFLLCTLLYYCIYKIYILNIY